MIGSAACRALAVAAALSVPACAALRDGEGPAGARGPTGLAAAEGEEDDCELLVVRRGEGAQVVDEKTPEDAEGFVWLGSQDVLLEQFRVAEEEDDDCLLAFGLQFGSGGGGGAGGAGGLASSAFGGTLAPATLAGLAAVIGGGVLLGVVAGGGNGGNTTSTTSTIPATE